MTVRGHVKNGAVVLDAPMELPDGAVVEVRAVPTTETPPEGGKGPSLLEQFGDLVGAAEGLPPDLAENHDHYLYGVPKRK
jgi:hypothetical protein